jgi:hypothetical protein
MPKLGDGAVTVAAAASELVDANYVVDWFSFDCGQNGSSILILGSLK